MIVQNFASCHVFAVDGSVIMFERHHMTVATLNPVRETSVAAVALYHELWWYNRPARRRTVAFLVEARRRGFEVTVSRQPSWVDM